MAESHPGSVSPERLLLAEFIVALVLGAWAGGLRIPYDSAMGLFALLACLALALTALFRAGRGASAPGVRRLVRWGTVLAVIAVQPLVWLALVSAFRVADERATMARFERDRDRYDCIVAHVARRTWEKGRRSITACGGTATVHVTDQVRVELESAGYFSNWEVIVHDPGESLRLIESSSRNLGSPDLRSALGKIPIGYCRRLSGKYFFCGVG